MKNLKLILAGIAVILVVIVVLQNTESVETRLLFATVTMPRAALLFVHLAIGFLVGLVVGARGRKRDAAAKA